MMSTTIIKHGKVVESPYDRVDVEHADIMATNVLLPASVWLMHRQSLLQRRNVGIWFDAHEEVEQLKDDVRQLTIIALNFPIFSDGRSLSSAAAPADLLILPPAGSITTGR